MTDPTDGIDAAEILWSPTDALLADSQIARYMGWLREARGLEMSSYDALWDWSVSDLDGFWSSIWEYFGLLADGAPYPVLVRHEMPGATWFPNLRTNWAEHVLARAPAAVAVQSWSQTRELVELTGDDLRRQTAAVRTGLQRLGVGRGDRVVAYMPNISETLVLLLATASLGAIFSSCPPEFGVRSVIDRFGQIQPVVLVAVDGYRHRGGAVSRSEEICTIRQAVPSIWATVIVPYLDDAPPDAGALPWSELIAETGDLTFERVPFAFPLYVLYSSGTTGLPKPIVHGHGGILVEHTKTHHLHHDLGPGRRFFWYSTTGWVMWNYLISGLLTGASVVLFDGDPGYPDLETLWTLAERAAITDFGVSAPFLLGCRKAGLRPARDHDLSALRQVGSTGAPLPADGFRWIYDEVGSDVVLVSASGGTDICGAFVAGAPILPVAAGEITCRCLGAKVEAFDEHGEPVFEHVGELVVTEPMPSMPVGFWGDDDGSRYRSSYFERFPGVWTHGDWITISRRGTCRITGRSDSTLNRGGVRLGTSDFYTCIEALDEIADSLVIHLEDSEGGAGELLLFVALAPDHTLDASLAQRVRSSLRTELSPRHVPDHIVAVASVPRTLSGKRLEVPVKRILQGLPADQAASRDSLLDPKALDVFVKLAGDRRRSGAR